MTTTLTSPDESHPQALLRATAEGYREGITPQQAAAPARTRRYDNHISTTCAHCGQWARQHLPECASGAPWARFARRMAREFACDQRVADGYARLFWPHIDDLGGEGAIIDAGRHGQLGKIQDRVALLARGERP